MRIRARCFVRRVRTGVSAFTERAESNRRVEVLLLVILRDELYHLFTWTRKGAVKVDNDHDYRKGSSDRASNLLTNELYCMASTFRDFRQSVR